MALAIGYDKSQDIFQSANASANLQQTAAILRQAGIEPDAICIIDLQGNSPHLQNVFRKGTDYQ